MAAPSQYFYERGLRKIARTPQEVAATPSNEELTLSYVAGKTAEEERAKGVAGRLNLKEKWLDEQAREHGQEMALARDALSAAGRQNRGATALSVANLGVAGGAAYMKFKETEEQQKMYDDLLKSQQGYMDLLKALLQKKIDIWKAAGAQPPAGSFEDIY